MKIIIGLIAILVTSGSLLAYYLMQQDQRQTQQLSDYEKHVQQLLQEIEQGSLKRLNSEKEIARLQSEVTVLESGLMSVTSQLDSAQQQVAPEYEALERQIRRQVRSELQNQETQSVASSNTRLIRELAALDPAELGELMALQGQYGGFLQSLDVNDERMDVIVGALSNLVAEQDQARMDLMRQMQDPSFNRRDIRGQLEALNNPASQLESLSFVLTEEELALFSAFQATQQSQPQIFRSFSTNPGGVGPPTGGAVFINGVRGGGNENFEVQVLPINPQ